MARKKRFTSKQNTAVKEELTSTVFEFGGIERVDVESPIATTDVEFDQGEGFYNPPIEPKVLSGLLTANSYHGSIVEARTRILSKNFIETDLMSFADMMNVCKDLVTFGYAYIQLFKNVYGQPLRLGHVMAQYTRRGKDNRFCRLNPDDTRTWYKKDEIVQIKMYDPNQNIYALPDYLSGIESALLSQDATRFRRRYYKNGMHMGFILYTTDPSMTPESEEVLADALKKSRGVGNFSSMLINIPNGQEKGVQLIPVGNIGSKDEFEGIKKISSQEIMVAHRFPPGLGGILPPEGGSLGNPLQYSQMYYENEITPLQKLICGVNRFLSDKTKVSFEEPKQVV
ncbi:phage portal protein [Photobacterium damselae]|uniref:phage portal protein n=1 Tax=Photobacterium damselae TaxID=38293 RepID=UPI002F4140FA